ncbi:MAG TPA: hypothetical protein VGM77_04855 [Gemmatimonadales bacterium]
MLDLASPWCAAVEGSDSSRLRTIFHNRHRARLTLVGRQCAPGEQLPLPLDRTVVRRAADRAADPALQQRIRTMLDDAMAHGIDQCRLVVLLPAWADQPSAEPLPVSQPWVALFLAAAARDAELLGVLAQALAAVTRWTATDAQSPLLAFRQQPWDRWERARHIPLSEWLYTEGIGLHLAMTLVPELSPAECLGISAAEYARLRDRERTLRALLDVDLDQTGLGLVLRWLIPGTPAGPRTVGDTVIPRRAGAYLAWRMVADRVRRVGIGDAVRMGADG